jgi:hypothetical protein
MKGVGVGVDEPGHADVTTDPDSIWVVAGANAAPNGGDDAGR